MSDFAARALLTYLLHSTVLLGLAALVRRALGERRLAVQEAVLRAALVGAFATTALQVGLDLQPLGGALRLPAGARAGRPGTHPATAVTASEALLAPPAAVAAPVAAPVAASRWEARLVLAATPAERALALALEVSWRKALTFAWAALAAFALLRLAVAALRLRRLLRDREPLRDARLAPQAARLAGALGLRASVRLSTAPHLDLPLATGVLRPEVCLPIRAVAELGPDEQVALCAHELAHVARRDPAWVLLARLAEALAPLQPLNAWARRRLCELSECLSDDLAVAASARPAGLARSLVDVAAWTVVDRPLLPAAAAGALSARSRLGHRVERIMDPLRSLERPRRSLFPLASAAVLATALLTPVVSATAPSVAAQPQAASTVESSAPVAEAVPVPNAAPAAAAQPSPRAQAAPEPAARAAARADLERQIEALGQRIEQRARLHDDEMKALEHEMQALAERLQPNEAEMQRLGKELEAVAQELATASLEAAGQGPGARDAARRAEALRRMAELQRQMQAKAGTIDAEQSRALAEKARAMAERVRPTEPELAELQRLSRELARTAALDSREVSRQMRAAMDEARRAMQQAAEELRRAALAASRAAEPDKARE